MEPESSCGDWRGCRLQRSRQGHPDCTPRGADIPRGRRAREREEGERNYSVRLSEAIILDLWTSFELTQTSRDTAPDSHMLLTKVGKRDSIELTISANNLHTG